MIIRANRHTVFSKNLGISVFRRLCAEPKLFEKVRNKNVVQVTLQNVQAQNWQRKKLAQAPNVKAQIPGTKKWSHDEKRHKT